MIASRRFATQPERFVLWHEQHGLCASCHEPLDLSEADHIKTFAEGGATAIPNMQLLCLPCHDDKTKQDQQRIKSTQKGQSMSFVRRKGQQAWRDFMDTHPHLTEYPGRFPTGYGKTEILLDGYDSLRRSNNHNRLLVVVPTDTQLRQYVEDLERKARMMGITLRGVIAAEANEATIKYHNQNRAEVFVTTVQRVVHAVKGKGRAGQWLHTLMEQGSWVGAADEYHHYAETNGAGTRETVGWGDALRQLSQIKQWMAVSATPERKAGSTIFGMPLVAVTYVEALQEPNVVKRVGIYTRDYKVDVIMDEGAARGFTTTELREEIGTEDIDKWETRRQLRYLAQYASPILSHAIAELERVTIEAPQDARPQMLIYTHSCAMAKTLTGLMRELALGFRVDWVGTGDYGRPEHENTHIITAFMDKVNDQREVIQPHTIDILIQVNKAGEGFDSKPVCVIVDLSLHGFGPQKLQQYGRGTRDYHDLELSIFVPTDSEIARLAPERERIFDLAVDTQIGAGQTESKSLESENGLWPPLPKMQVKDAQLIGGQNFEPSREQILGVAPFIAREVSKHRGIHVILDPEHNPQDYEMIRAAMLGFHAKTHANATTTANKQFWNDKAEKALSMVARRAVIILHQPFDPALLGPYRRCLSTRWAQQHGPTNKQTATDEDYRAKYNWLADLDAAILGDEVPAWLHL